MLDSETTLAIILGVSECPRAPNLQPLPQCRNSAEDFEHYLRTNLNLSSFRVLNLFDVAAPASEQLEQIEDFLARHVSAERRPKDLILYYSGHGGFTGNDQAYFLAVQKTRQGSEGATSIRYIDLASTIKRRANKLRKYLILDCCFAAAAAVRTQSDIGQLQVSRVKEELPQSGMALLCSSAAKLVSIAPAGERNTMFSGALLECLKQGIDGAGQTLSLEEVGNRARDLISEKFPEDSVRPELHVPEQPLGDPAKVPLFPNPRWVEKKNEQDPSRPVNQPNSIAPIPAIDDPEPDGETSTVIEETYPASRRNEIEFRGKASMTARRKWIQALVGAGVTGLSLLGLWSLINFFLDSPLQAEILPKSAEIRQSSSDTIYSLVAEIYTRKTLPTYISCVMQLRATTGRVYESNKTFTLDKTISRVDLDFGILGQDIDSSFSIRVVCNNDASTWSGTPYAARN